MLHRELGHHRFAHPNEFATAIVSYFATDLQSHDTQVRMPGRNRRFLVPRDVGFPRVSKQIAEYFVFDFKSRPNSTKTFYCYVERPHTVLSRWRYDTRRGILRTIYDQGI